ncbi:unnamed protein product [Protopolystoma xenopodis]|uniref:Uncharacterized protein n=1 Tax=Protopolystoma xenopodis TaxID=117903 RepID=A0A448WVU2_9PLAT|nr:unnamed protein product [Protopolystoma xenopodis]
MSIYVVTTTEGGHVGDCDSPKFRKKRGVSGHMMSVQQTGREGIELKTESRCEIPRMVGKVIFFPIE